MNDLSSLTRAVEQIADNTRSPFRRMEESSRHNDILKIQNEQTKILKKQNRFNLILALATTMLAIGVFIEIIMNLINKKSNFSEIHWAFSSLLIFWITIFFVFMGGIIILLINILFYRKRKN